MLYFGEHLSRLFLDLIESKFLCSKEYGCDLLSFFCQTISRLLGDLTDESVSAQESDLSCDGAAHEPSALAL